MRTSTKVTLLVTAVAALMWWGAPAMAFHDGGVADCAGCHTMHNGPSNPASDTGGFAYLLTEEYSTDVCLGCHATRLGNTWGASLAAPGDNYGGGAFIFLTAAGLNDGHGAPADIPGERAGHNVLSNTYSVGVDVQNTTAPGGMYPNTALTCTSCHDPHGKHLTGQPVHFRLLHGKDPGDLQNRTGNSLSTTYAFSYSVPAPSAEGLDVHTAGGEGLPTDETAHTWYQAGMSEWCGSCHGDYHTGAVSFVHDSGTGLGTTIAANYNLYHGSGDFTGVPGSAYLTLVPFEDPDSVLYGTGTTQGPDGNSNVMCLTCHRAHASSGPWSGRWDFNLAFPFDPAEEGVASGTEAILNPYGPATDTTQRSMCNKCHLQDPGI